MAVKAKSTDAAAAEAAAPTTEVVKADVSVAPKVIEAAPAAKTETTAAPVFGAAPVEVKKGMEKAMKTAEEFVAFSKDNAEAIVKSSQIWFTGVQDLSKHFAAAAQASMEESMSTFKAFAGVKSIKEVIDLQTALARSTIEKTVAETGKLTDASFKLTEQALAPITARVSVAVEKFSKAA